MDKINKANSIKYNLTWDSLKINKDEKEIKEKLDSKMSWDGILLNYKDKESKIKISFDDISNNI